MTLDNHSYGRLLWAPNGGARDGRGNTTNTLVSPDSDRGPTSFVVPDPDPVSTVGRGTGAATTQPRLPRLRSGATTPPVVPDPDPVPTVGRRTGHGAIIPPIRRAGLRSGTHGGDRDGRGYNHTRSTIEVPGLISSCRTPIRYPRWGAGQGAAPPFHPFVVPDPDPAPTVGRGKGAATTQPRLPRLRSGATTPSSCRTPIRYPRWGSGQGAATPPTHSNNHR